MAFFRCLIAFGSRERRFDSWLMVAIESERYLQKDEWGRLPTKTQTHVSHLDRQTESQSDDCAAIDQMNALALMKKIPLHFTAVSKWE